MFCSHSTTYWRVTHIFAAQQITGKMDFPVFALSPNVFHCTSPVLERLTYCKRESSSESKRLKWRGGQKIQKVWSNTTSFANLLNICAISEPFCCSYVLQDADRLMTFCGRFLKHLRLFSVVGPQCWYWDVSSSTMLVFAFSERSKSVKIVQSNAWK